MPVWRQGVAVRKGQGGYAPRDYVIGPGGWGTVTDASAERVTAYNLETGKKWSAPVSEVRRMSENEMARYNEIIPAGCPTPTQIKKRAAECRAAWDEDTYYERRNAMPINNVRLRR
jgi:hypothetical protein